MPLSPTNPNCVFDICSLIFLLQRLKKTDGCKVIGDVSPMMHENRERKSMRRERQADENPITSLIIQMHVPLLSIQMQAVKVVKAGIRHITQLPHSLNPW